MKRTAAELVRYALEQIGVTHTFGIPGVHNTEIYDQLAASPTITPVLVTHEAAASFMADAVSRTTDTIGTCVIVPAAGVTHAASGIAEAYLDGIAMLVISGGVRSDTGRAYQLHDMDQHSLLRPITKATFKVSSHADVVPTIYEACRIAISGVPGPVFVEIPVDLQLFKGEIASLPRWQQEDDPPASIEPDALDRAASLLVDAERPGLFVGWGARGLAKEIARIAETLSAPVATTLQGLGVFSATHPLHVGMGFGTSSVPAAERAFAKCDAMLAVGVRFAEIATGSYGRPPPAALVHIDIDPAVIGANYPAQVGLVGDAKDIVPALAQRIGQLVGAKRDTLPLIGQIASDKSSYRAEWRAHKGEGVNPEAFFTALREALPEEGIVVTDDGNHTFLTAELMPMTIPGGFISPTDFNCMGYCVPAVNGVALTHPDTPVVGIVGDGAFLMTGMETITAVEQRLGVVYFVFSDGELSQISQAQKVPLNRKTCTVLGHFDVAGIAQATGALFRRMERSDEAASIIADSLALAKAERHPVIIDVRIDYSKQTRFTKGTIATNLKRFDTPTKLRFIGRAIARKITG